MEMSIRITQVLTAAFMVLLILSVSISAYGMYHDWPTKPERTTKMKVRFCDLKKRDKFADGEIVEFARSYGGNTHLVFESGKRFVISDNMLITIEREEAK